MKKVKDTNGPAFWDKMFPITSICREDLIQHFTMQKILTLDDADMRHIAEKIGNTCLNILQLNMETIVRDVLKINQEAKRLKILLRRNMANL